MKRFADPDSVLLPKRSQNTFLTESQELSVASPGGDSHEPLAVILQPYFLSQPELSLLKMCPSVIHLTITSFPVGFSTLGSEKKHLFAKNPFSFLIQVCLQPLQRQLCSSFSTRFSEWVWAPSSESPACGQREIKFQGQEGPGHYSIGLCGVHPPTSLSTQMPAPVTLSCTCPADSSQPSSGEIPNGF